MCHRATCWASGCCRQTRRRSAAARHVGQLDASVGVDVRGVAKGRELVGVARRLIPAEPFAAGDAFAAARRDRRSTGGGVLPPHAADRRQRRHNERDRSPARPFHAVFNTVDPHDSEPTLRPCVAYNDAPMPTPQRRRSGVCVGACVIASAHRLVGPGPRACAGLRLGFHRAGRVRPGSDRPHGAVRRRAGWPDPRRAQRHRAAAPTSSIFAAAVLAGGERGSARTGVSHPTRRAAGSSSTSPIDPATRSSPGSGARRIRSSPIPRRDSIFGSAAPAARRSSRSRFRITTAGISRSDPTDICTSASATAAPATIPDHRAQNPQELLGKMLRIDVNVPDTHAIGYQVPADNPFVGGRPIAARPEIWAFGLRNPWRYSFDDPARGGTGALVIGDVGQNAFEEIDYEPPNRGGRNYGWRNREGAHDNVTSRPPAFLPLVDPIHEYGRASGQSITGGYVYRGRSLGAAVRRALLLCRLRAGPRLVARARRSTARVRRASSDLMEHTGGARRPEPARQHQLVRRRRRRRALHRQPLARAPC